VVATARQGPLRVGSGPQPQARPRTFRVPPTNGRAEGQPGVEKRRLRSRPDELPQVMQKNFSIGAMGAEVIVGASPIDLHNLYSTSDISTDLAGDTITLAFDRDHRWKGPDALPERVLLKCSGNLRIAFNNLAGTAVPVGEDAVEIAYYDAGCGWEHFLDEDLATSQGFEGLHISFSGGLVLRITCASAEITAS